MNVLWMTSLRPIGKSVENDRIQEIFIESLINLNSKITLSLTQFDDEGIEDYINKKILINILLNIPQKFLAFRS